MLLQTQLRKDKHILHDEVPRECILSVFKDSDLFVMPSTEETVGLVYLEAMSQGCIPIGTKGEGIDGIIVDGSNGLLVNPMDEMDLSRCILRLFDMNTDNYVEIRKKAIETGRQYNEIDMGYRYLYLITKPLNNTEL